VKEGRKVTVVTWRFGRGDDASGNDVAVGGVSMVGEGYTATTVAFMVAVVTSRFSPGDDASDNGVAVAGVSMVGEGYTAAAAVVTVVT
jgi:hypothetical protein